MVHVQEVLISATQDKHYGPNTKRTNPKRYLSFAMSRKLESSGIRTAF